jgi:hypothetical protein
MFCTAPPCRLPLIHGINIEDGFPPPEQLLDYRADRVEV